MHPGSGEATHAADTGAEPGRGTQAGPLPAMHVLNSLRAGHYARQCAPHHRRLCTLLAAHALSGIGPIARKRIGAGPAMVPEARTQGMQDALAASHASSGVQGRRVRTPRPDEG